MDVNYIEIEEPFDTKYPTWIIAFCPDTDSFFVTNYRYFFWEFDKEFDSEKEGIDYFITHVEYFMNIDKELMSHMFYNDIHVVDSVYLENTKTQYYN